MQLMRNVEMSFLDVGGRFGENSGRIYSSAALAYAVLREHVAQSNSTSLFRAVFCSNEYLHCTTRIHGTTHVLGPGRDFLPSHDSSVKSILWVPQPLTSLVVSLSSPSHRWKLQKVVPFRVQQR